MCLARGQAGSTPGARRSFTRRALALCQSMQCSRSPVLGRGTRGQGLQSGVLRPVLALALGLLSPASQSCADPSASHGPPLPSLQWGLLTRFWGEAALANPLGLGLKRCRRPCCS